MVYNLRMDYALTQDRNCARCTRLVSLSNMIGDFCYQCSTVPAEKCVRCNTDAGREIARALSGKLIMLCDNCGENYIAAGSFYSG